MSSLEDKYSRLHSIQEGTTDCSLWKVVAVQSREIAQPWSLNQVKTHKMHPNALHVQFVPKLIQMLTFSADCTAETIAVSRRALADVVGMLVGTPAADVPAMPMRPLRFAARLGMLAAMLPE